MERYPLVEAIFELRWGERSPGRFNFSKEDTDIFYQKFAMQASLHNFIVVETPNLDAPPIPYLVKYRYRTQEDTWPCYQTGLGLFTVNQIQDGYNRNQFLSDIEAGMKIWINSLSGHLEKITETLIVSLRYQNAFYKNKDLDVINKLEKTLGIKINFPEEYSTSLGDLNSLNMNFGISCKTSIKSTAQISISDAVIEGTPGLFVDTAVESKLIDIIDIHDSGDLIKSKVSEWLNEAYTFQKSNYEMLMQNS
ncbi:TIGR04255 family protein [Aeromonas salmonicida]|uniref:TIGR04255 family protein n=1 Tax=Aeromonas salmonicida TaxID=645 RepID=UPI0024A82AF1|nr:TIGR04255 family protein [Aeromonas salmonicida]MDM5137615.1 TIGR04255 family protein [Aeromonas salmonicida]WHF40525.1 TIGR04255 family protein [Aeromonas salmonicida]